MEILELHISFGFFIDFLMILILLVLCEFLIVFKLLRTQEFVADTDSHGYIGISHFGRSLWVFDDFDFARSLRVLNGVKSF